ncbi:MAG: choice-of-anchor D domain-containing protein [Ilumatobacteraceae bacterium]
MSLNRRVSAVLAAVLLTAAVVVSDVRLSGSASPPAELMSVITEIGDSFDASISGDGAFVAFDFSDLNRDGSTRLVKVRNRAVPTTESVPFISARGIGQSSGVISRDGCHFAHIANAPIGQFFGSVVVVSDRCTGAAPIQIAQQTRSQAQAPWTDLVISAHGRYVALSDTVTTTVQWFDRDADQNGVLDDSAVVSKSTDVPASSPSLGDETMTNRVALTAMTAAGTQIYLWDPTGAFSLASTIVSAADATTTPMAGVVSARPSMSPDARYIAFESRTPNPLSTVLISAASQVLVRDTVTNRTVLISRNANGTAANASSVQASISADGTQIAFATLATDVLAPGVGGQTNRSRPSLDLLVAVSTSGFYGTVAFDRVSLTPNGTAIDPKNNLMAMQRPVISSNGRFVAFESTFAAELQRGEVTDTSGEIFVTFPSDVYVIGRPTTLSISPLSFGQVTVATTSAPQLATVTNTGTSSVLPASITAGSDYAIVGGGNCLVGAWLSPGQSCSVAVQFTPTSNGNRAANLTVAENGFAPVSASGSLSGTGFTPVGSVPPIVTAPPIVTSPPIVTVPPVVTVPKVAQLTITPNPASFGMMMVDVAAAPIVFSVTSTGTATAPIDNVSISGSSDFAITDNGCQGAALAPGTSCPVTVTFTPTLVGPMAATLSAGSSAATASADLSGDGTLQPRLRLLPDVIGLGDVAIAVGAGFIPNMAVQMQWAGYSDVYAGTTDASGGLQLQIPIRLDDISGPRTLNVIDQPGLFTGVSTPALIVPGSAHPPTAPNPALLGLTSLVVR